MKTTPKHTDASGPQTVTPYIRVQTGTESIKIGFTNQKISPHAGLSAFASYLHGQRMKAVLAAALQPSLETPLGSLAGGVRLADIARRDRLDELEFELPLAGGDTPRGEVRVSEIAGLLRQHLGSEDRLVGYADDLDLPLLDQRRLRGFLTGSIDSVLRVRSDGGPPRYLVVDYKTNYLGSGEVLTGHPLRSTPA